MLLLLLWKHSHAPPLAPTTWMRMFSAKPISAPSSKPSTTAPKTPPAALAQSILQTLSLALKKEHPSRPSQDRVQTSTSEMSQLPSRSHHVVHIQSSRNNTIVALTKPNGDNIAWASAGTIGLRKSHRGTSDAGYQAVLQLHEKAVAKGVDLLANASRMGVEVRLKGFGAGREMAFRAVRALGWTIRRITDVTPIRHAGCRPKRKRRL